MAETLLDTLVLAVRADTRSADRAIGQLKAELGGLAQAAVRGRSAMDGLARSSPGEDLASGVDRAGQRMEAALERFVRTGRLGFGSLRQLALAALGDIADAALRSAIPGLGSAPGSGLGGAGKGGGIGGLLGAALGGLLGLPGRALGGPVEPGRAYRVGERGPELFVPARAGRIEPAGTARGQRPISIAITLHGGERAERTSMARSAAQVAQSVRHALARAERDA